MKKLNDLNQSCSAKKIYIFVVDNFIIWHHLGSKIMF
jgi:hypothetical protein